MRDQPDSALRGWVLSNMVSSMPQLALLVQSGRGVELVEASAGGEAIDPTAPPTPCLHAASWLAEVVTANGIDDAGGIVWREALLKLRCAECGHVAAFDYGSARASAQPGQHGCVIVFAPA